MRRLVTTLLVVMIVGFLVLIGLLVTRFPSGAGSAPLLPADIALPEGATAGYVTAGAGWYGVVITNPGGTQQFLIYEAQTGTLLQSVDLTLPE